MSIEVAGPPNVLMGDCRVNAEAILRLLIGDPIKWGLSYAHFFIRGLFDGKIPGDRRSRFHWCQYNN